MSEVSMKSNVTNQQKRLKPLNKRMSVRAFRSLAAFILNDLTGTQGSIQKRGNSLQAVTSLPLLCERRWC
ncbi:MAG: hypothetical protein DMG39_23525 [Acidobacteria bacterium]|nr:MAG: hypothetical protein DMG39_23525 [Acidobacteriota bacterium]